MNLEGWTAERMLNVWLDAAQEHALRLEDNPVRVIPVRGPHFHAGYFDWWPIAHFEFCREATQEHWRTHRSQDWIDEVLHSGRIPPRGPRRTAGYLLGAGCDPLRWGATLLRASLFFRTNSRSRSYERGYPDCAGLYELIGTMEPRAWHYAVTATFPQHIGDRGVPHEPEALIRHLAMEHHEVLKEETPVLVYRAPDDCPLDEALATARVRAEVAETRRLQDLP